MRRTPCDHEPLPFPPPDNEGRRAVGVRGRAVLDHGGLHAGTGTAVGKPDRAAARREHGASGVSALVTPADGAGATGDGGAARGGDDGGAVRAHGPGPVGGAHAGATGGGAPGAAGAATAGVVAGVSW